MSPLVVIISGLLATDLGLPRASRDDIDLRAIDSQDDEILDALHALR